MVVGLVLFARLGEHVSYASLRPRAAAAPGEPAQVAQIAGAQTRAVEVAVVGESLGEI